MLAIRKVRRQNLDLNAVLPFPKTNGAQTRIAQTQHRIQMFCFFYLLQTDAGRTSRDYTPSAKNLNVVGVASKIDFIGLILVSIDCHPRF